MPINRRTQGTAGEQLAADYLASHGCRILERNYRFERGEIDLVAEDGDDLVFVEVKARHTRTFGDPEDSITPQKEDQIKNVAEGYLFEHEMEDRNCRFDVVAIEFVDGRAEIRHIKDAF